MHPKRRAKYIVDTLPFRAGMYRTADECIRSMRILLAFDDQRRKFRFSTNDRSIHLLAALALELYAKVLIFSREIKSGKDIKAVSKSIEKFGHDLSKLYSKDGIGNYLSRKCGIRKVKVFQRTHGYRPGNYPLSSFGYLFELYGRKDDWDRDVLVHDLESVRYGLLARSPKEQTDVHLLNPGRLLELCMRVQREILKEIGTPRYLDPKFKRELDIIAKMSSSK